MVKKFIKGLSALGLALSLTATPLIADAAQNTSLASEDSNYKLEDKKMHFNEKELKDIEKEMAKFPKLIDGNKKNIY